MHRGAIGGGASLLEEGPGEGGQRQQRNMESMVGKHLTQEATAMKGLNSVLPTLAEPSSMLSGRVQRRRY